MTVEDDGPYESKNDGRPSVYDVRDVYVHQFNLVKHNTKKSTKWRQKFQHFAVFRKDLPTFSWGSTAPSRRWPSAERHRDPSAFSAARQQQLLQSFSLELRRKHLKRDKLTIGWPLITSSRLRSCEPSRRSEKMSDTNVGGLLCKMTKHSAFIKKMSIGQIFNTIFFF